MAKQETAEILICIDCMMLLANGEEPVDPDPRNDPPLSKIGDDVEITPGAAHEDWCPAKDNDSVDCQCEHIDFSWSRCAGCGSTLGGDRFKATLWFDTPESSQQPTEGVPA